MKIQDIVFFAFLAILIYKSNPKFAAASGIFLLFISIPLFSLWVFFTAERLVWYATAFFLLSALLQILNLRKNER